MSCHVGIRCLDHNSETGCAMNHGQRTLTQIIKMAPYFKEIEPSIKKIIELDETGYITFGIGLFDSFYWDVNMFEWLCEHGNCRLKLYDEYDFTY